jgi:hypothetical protein
MRLPTGFACYPFESRHLRCEPLLLGSHIASLTDRKPYGYHTEFTYRAHNAFEFTALWHYLDQNHQRLLSSRALIRTHDADNLVLSSGSHFSKGLMASTIEQAHLASLLNPQDMGMMS